MGLKAALSLPFAKWVTKKNYKWAKNAKTTQIKTLKCLIRKAEKTTFGIDHGFEKINPYEDFKKAVPIRTYEDLKTNHKLL